MAKAQASGGNGKGKAAEAPAGVPAGFRRRSTVSDANWVANEKGNVCHGTLLGRHAMSTEPVRFYYQVELKSPCKVRVGKGDDAEVQQAEVGEVVNLNENFKLACLKELEIPEILAGAAYEVYVTFEDKIKIGGGKTMWNIEVSSKQLKAPTSAVRPLPKDDVAAGDDEGAEGSAPF